MMPPDYEPPMLKEEVIGIRSAIMLAWLTFTVGFLIGAILGIVLS